MKWLWVLLLPGLAWGQMHEILRPTADNSTMNCSADINVPSSAMPQSRDAAGLSTLSSLNLTNTDPFNTKATVREFNTWTGSSQTYSALTLNVNSSGAKSAGPGGSGLIQYSVNGGSTWTTIRTSTSPWSQVTDTIVLNANQDLTQVKVSACSFANNNDGSRNGTWFTSIWDIWTDGIYTPSTPTPTPTPAVPPPAPAIPQPSILSRLRQWLNTSLF